MRMFLSTDGEIHYDLYGIFSNNDGTFNIDSDDCMNEDRILDDYSDRQKVEAPLSCLLHP